jgi:RNA polymerase sigma factor (sigma-70 family)
VFASVAFKWIRAYILLELNKYAKIVKPQKLTVNKDDLEYQEFLKENDIYEYEVATENPLTVINLDSVNPYTDDCYHDNDLQEVTQEEFLIEDEALENEERTNTFKEIVNDVLFKLNALDRRIIKKRFGIGLPYEMSIQEIADSENITINKVKYSLSSSFKQIKNYIKPEDLKSLYESL